MNTKERRVRGEAMVVVVMRVPQYVRVKGGMGEEEGERERGGDGDASVDLSRN